MSSTHGESPVTGTTAPFHITLFGHFALYGPDDSEIVITIKRARTLLAILCIEPGHAYHRDTLAGLLWDGRYRAQARASLRQTLLGLKKQLMPLHTDVFEVSRETVAVKPQAVRTDLLQLEDRLARGSGASELMLAIGGSPLLDGVKFGNRFEQWRRTCRAEVEQRLTCAIERALADCLQRGAHDEHARLGEAWQLRNPANTSVRADPRIRIAVTPFTAPDGPSHVSLGLSDELMTTLAQIPQLRVAGRVSSMLVGQFEQSLPALARTLRVAYLVQGTVQQQGDQVRVHISLVDGHTGYQSWAQSYRGKVGDVFELQEDIAYAVCRELAVVLKLPVQVPSQRRTTQNKAAYELYLQGRALTTRAIGDGLLPKAVELLQASLAMDPSFAACWTALAEAHVYTAVFTPCLDRLAKSRQMAECAMKAIELDPRQGHARAMLGIHKWTLNDPVGALDLAFEAYRLEPDNADVTLRLGSFLLYVGRTREAMPYIEKAIDQDPINGKNYAMLTTAHLNLGNLEAAIAAGQSMADMGMPSMWQAIATRTTGDHAAAFEQYYRSRLLMNSVILPPAGAQPQSDKERDAYWRLAAEAVCSGCPEARLKYGALLDNLHATLSDPGDVTIVLPAIWMGYPEIVFKTLGQQITPSSMYSLMSLWSDVEPIRQVRLHPDFMAFAERIGLTAAWEKYGWPDLLERPESFS